MIGPIADLIAVETVDRSYEVGVNNVTDIKWAGVAPGWIAVYIGEEVGEEILLFPPHRILEVKELR